MPPGPLQALFLAVESGVRALGTPRLVRRIDLGGRVLEVRFHDADALADAFDEAPGAGPDATLTVAALRLPPAPFAVDGYVGNGAVRGGVEGPLQAAFDIGEGALTLWDAQSRRGYYCLRPGGALESWMLAAPFKTFVQWWVAEREQLIVHAAAVASTGGAVLLAGRGGSGKSTTALRAALGGLGHLSDDYALVDPAPAPRVYPCFRTIKLWPGELERECRHLAAAAVTLPAQKAVAYVRGGGLDAAPVSPLRAIVVPRVTDQATTTLLPLAPAAALRALLPESVFPFPHQQAAAVAGLGRLVRARPAWALNLGADAAAPGLLRDLASRA